MRFGHLAAWFSGVALLGTGAALIRAQPPQPPREGPTRHDRAKLRAEVIKLRTEVEMLRFDYELTRDGLMEDVKTRKALKMAGGMMQLGAAIQTAINEAQTTPPGDAPRHETEQDRRKAAEEARKAQQEEAKEAAEEAAFLAERRKELTRRAASWAEKRMDLDDAERDYRATFP
jgi:hypothetical protein